MKKISTVILSFMCLVSFLPVNVFAEDVPIGMDIDGEVIISAVTTINTTLKLDVVARESTTSYVRTANTGNTDLDFSIIDITAVGVGSPSTFVNYSSNEPTTGKSWLQLNEAETKQYISFGMSKDAINYVSILPDTVVKMGRVSSHMDGAMGSSGLDNDEDGSYANPSRSFALRARTGYIWGSTTSISYTITTLVELSADFDNITPKHTDITSLSLGSVGTDFNSILTLVADYSTETTYVAPSINDVVFNGRIISPTGVVTTFQGKPNVGTFDMTDNGTSHSYRPAYTIPTFTFTEHGIYFVEFGFGFMDGSSFVPDDNYGQVISITIE